MAGAVLTVVALVLGMQASTSGAQEDDRWKDDLPEGWESIPDSYTQEHVEWLMALIERNEQELQQWNDTSILEEQGFVWIGDGRTPGGYQHWIKLDWYDDEHILNPDYPESLVFRTTEDGEELAAVMYHLPFHYDMDTIPSLVSWIPGWHAHGNLCFNESGQLNGVANPPDLCPDGEPAPLSPPMTHVWIEDNGCGPGMGRFAGIDIGGLQCEYEHDH